MIRYVAGAAAFLLPFAAVQAAENTVDKNAPEAVRCVKVHETGSLVKKQRICKTNAEWAKISQSDKRETDAFVGRSGGGSSSND